MDALSSLETLKAEISRPDLPPDAASAKKALGELSVIKHKIGETPLKELETQGQAVSLKRSLSPSHT